MNKKYSKNPEEYAAFVWGENKVCFPETDKRKFNGGAPGVKATIVPLFISKSFLK